MTFLEKQLKKYGVWRKFKKNSLKNMKNDKDWFENSLDKGCSILAFFYWKKTPEGHYFWDEINDKLKKDYETLREN